MKKFDYRVILVSVWLTFSIALATWQSIFVLRVFQNPELLQQVQSHFPKYLKMIQMENMTLLCSLLAGGISLFWLIKKEKQKTKELEIFLATFTHELKTSLTGLRLKSESNPDFLPLQPDLERIHLQLDNALYLARSGKENPIIEKLELLDLLSEIGVHPTLQIHLQKNETFFGDRSFILSVLKNVFQNAATHGKAENLWIVPLNIETTHRLGLDFNNSTKNDKAFLQIALVDDGIGVKEASAENLGQLFQRTSSTSGNGIGLYLIQHLMRQIGGRAHFLSQPSEILNQFIEEQTGSRIKNQSGNNGFAVILELPTMGTNLVATSGYRPLSTSTIPHGEENSGGRQ